MADENLVVEYRNMVEKRLVERIQRQLQVEQDPDLARLVESQIATEIAMLKRLLDSEENPAAAEILKGLILWLPSQRARLTRTRYTPG